ncbi:hypothetical protein [Rhodopila sp.]|uniref:hypothetical protein n=1 Tax=Rhodopila sp. TaxID=2480087 RepID=UPI003D0CA83B
MAGGWQVGPQLANPENVGAVPASTNPSTVYSSDTAFVKGPWLQLIAATASDTAWVLVQLEKPGGTTCALDIAIGAAGSEFVVLANLSLSGTGDLPAQYFFPLVIPAGTPVSARFASDQPFYGANINLTLFADGALSGGGGSAIDTYGFNVAAGVGTPVDPGATVNKMGAFAQLTASVTNDLAGFFLAFDGQDGQNGSGESACTLMQLAIGAAGSEKIILPYFYNTTFSYSGFVTVLNVNSPYFPFPIRAGSRVAVRMQSQTNVNPDRLMGVTLYGVRQ